MKTYSDQCQVTLKMILFLETKSLIGRLLFNKKPTLKKPNELNFLNLGCSSTIVEGWTNADFYSLHTLLYPWTKKDLLKPNWFLDLRYPLNCDDSVWDGIFTEHTLEHLYPSYAIQLLHELFRTLKHGGWLRVTVPDLKKYVDFYNHKTVDKEFKARWETGCEAIRSLTQDYFHHSLWDEHFLCEVLKECGFINIKTVSYREGTDKRLLIDREIRKWETLYIEAQKP